MAQTLSRSWRVPRLMAGMLFTRLWRMGTVYAVLFLVVALSLWLLEREVEGTKVPTFLDSLWLAICTISTVGYGDTYPVTTAGRTIVGLFILFTMVTIGFLLTAINEAVIEVKKMEEKGLLGTDFTGHIIVCGFSPVARTAIEELLDAEKSVAVICDQLDDLPLAQRLGPRPNFYCTAGELEQEVFRERLNAEVAQTAVVATNDDTANIIAALNLRAVNDKLRIVVSVKTEALRETLISSGVTYVASPFELSGRLVASAAFEPEVAQFVDDIASGIGGFDVQQFSAAPFAGKTVAETRAALIEVGGPLLVGAARAVEDGSFEIIPHPPQDLVLAGRDQILVVTDEEQTRLMQATYGLKQGR